MNDRTKPDSLINRIKNAAQGKKNDENQVFSEMDFVAEPENNTEADPFLYSLENLQPEEIELGYPVKKLTAADRVLEGIRVVMFGCSITVLVVCLFLLAQNLIMKQKGTELYDNLASEFLTEDFAGMFSDFTAMGNSDSNIVENDSSSGVSYLMQERQDNVTLSNTQYMEGQSIGTDEETIVSNSGGNAQLEKMKAQLSYYRQINEDVYGWIYIENTNVNYPLVQSDDNDYYLNHAFNGEYNPLGAIFVDFRNSESILDNFNTVMYGHNVVSNGTMFHEVTKFSEKDFFETNKIYIFTFDGAYVYEPFAYFKAKENYQYFRTSFPSTDEFVAFCEEMLGNSAHGNEETFHPNDRILTLSTCTNVVQSERYALQAKLVQIMK